MVKDLAGGPAKTRCELRVTRQARSFRAFIQGWSFHPPIHPDLQLMPTEVKPEADAPGWRVASASVRGSLHVRRGLPNQDACGWQTFGADGEFLLLAVADGHGNRRCIRSGDGARLAIEVVLELLAGLLVQPALQVPPRDAKRFLELDFPRRCVDEWRRRVEAHGQANALTEAESAALADGPADPSAVTDWYGSTLLAAIITPVGGAALQLGDGALVWVAADGGVFEPSVPVAEFLGDETHSLSSQNAGGLMRVAFQKFAVAVPVLVLVCTDGYAKSFRSAAAVRQATVDLLAACRAGEFAAVERQLPDWLAESASDQGSADDTTLLLAWCAAVDSPPAPQLAPAPPTAAPCTSSLPPG